MRKAIVTVLCLSAVVAWAGRAPKGKPVKPKKQQVQQQAALTAKVTGKVVWSSSRDGNHDIFIMNTNGTEKKHLTTSPKTDWFSRFSPDGSKVIFTRSKMDWTIETNAKNFKMWDTWIINADGTDEKKLIENATWATWRSEGKAIIFARGSQVFSFDIETATETLVMEAGMGGLKKGAILQTPHMSSDGKYLAITLRGNMRETGIWDIAHKTWQKTGLGCQINWYPGSAHKLVRMNPTGNGGSEVLSFEVKDGTLIDPDYKIKDQLFMDMPGRRSHEYFPQISSDNKWMVWGITQRGHDHDMVDYEIFIWELATPKDAAVRLTFHSGNDRWPDLFIQK